MSPGMSALSSIGITQDTLIIMFLVLIGVIVIGLFWHVIVPGAIIVSLVYLFLPTGVATTAKVKSEKTLEDVIEEIVVEDKVPKGYKDFMADCTTLGGYSTKRCEDRWNDRDLPDESVKVEQKPASKIEEVVVTSGKEAILLEVDNAEYKQRRAEVMKKPNAVVMQATYR